MTTPMEAITIAESKRLNELEATISKNESAMLDIAKALSEIHDRRLYKSEYSSFRDYCREKWGFGKSHAYRLIAFNEEAKVSPMGDIPKTEREARARKHAARKPIIDKPLSQAAVIDVEPQPAISPATARSVVKQFEAEEEKESQPAYKLSEFEEALIDDLRAASGDLHELIDEIRCGDTDPDAVSEAKANLAMLSRKLGQYEKSIRVEGK